MARYWIACRGDARDAGSGRQETRKAGRKSGFDTALKLGELVGAIVGAAIEVHRLDLFVAESLIVEARDLRRYFGVKPSCFPLLMPS